jgi:alpha-tubulin suppressor-like RCC1 family protein
MARRQGGTLSGFTPLSTPNAPIDLSVSTSIGSATVSFTAPTDTGDGAVTSYIVTAIDESTGASSGATGSASPITISPGGGTFKIRAQAVNGFGPGRLTEFDTGNLIYAGAELYSFGINSSRELGLGDGNNRSSPSQVGALTTWDNVSAGGSHSMAITTGGQLYAWGAGGQGRLGINSSPAYRLSPVQVGALTDWWYVFAGKDSTSATKLNGTLWGWGNNGTGVIGDNTIIDKSSPIQVGALTNWEELSNSVVSNNFVAAVKTDGTMWSWGVNTNGQLGDGTVVRRSSPVQIGALTTWAQVSANGASCFAVKTDNTFWSWGLNTDGQLGQGNKTARSSPVQVGALSNWSKVSAGTNFFVGVKTDGTIWSCGKGGGGKLGDNTTIDKSSPIQIGALTNWSKSTCGSAHTVAIKTDGNMWSWGYGSNGRLGDGNVVYRSSPVQIGSSTSWYEVSAGSAHTLALLGVV